VRKCSKIIFSIPFQAVSVRNFRSTIPLIALLKSAFAFAVLLNTNTVGLVLFFFKTLIAATRIKISKSKIFLTVCVVTFATMHVALAGFGEIGVELKLAVVLSAYAIASYYFCVPSEARTGNAMFWALTLYTVLALIIVFPITVRFPDHVGHSLISPYFGTLCVFIFAIVVRAWQRAIVIVCCCLAASGTGLLGLLTFLVLSKKRNWLAFPLVLGGLLAVLYWSQAERGRINVDWREIDRAALTIGTVAYMISDFGPRDWIFGAGLNATLPPDYYLTMGKLNQPVAEYVELEGGGRGSGRNFHNEHLRIIYHLGILGWLSLLWCTFRLIADRALLVALLVMGAVGSVFFSPFMLSAVMLAMQRRNKFFSSAA